MAHSAAAAAVCRLWRYVSAFAFALNFNAECERGCCTGAVELRLQYDFDEVWGTGDNGLRESSGSASGEYYGVLGQGPASVTFQLQSADHVAVDAEEHRVDGGDWRQWKAESSKIATCLDRTVADLAGSLNSKCNSNRNRKYYMKIEITGSIYTLLFVYVFLSVVFTTCSVVLCFFLSCVLFVIL